MFMSRRPVSLPAPAAALNAEEKDLFWDAYALALADAKVHERFVPLLGVAQGNGQVLFRRLCDYIVGNELVDPAGWIHADDLLAEFLGERDFRLTSLSRLLRGALHISPLSAEQVAAFGRGDAELLRRIAHGFDAVERDANPSPFRWQRRHRKARRKRRGTHFNSCKAGGSAKAPAKGVREAGISPLSLTSMERCGFAGITRNIPLQIGLPLSMRI
jgi:hypothetical protein